MTGYRDRTYCAAPACGNQDCSRILSADEKARAVEMGIPIAYASGCISPKPKDDPTHD